MKHYNGKMTKGETCPFLAALAGRMTGAREQEPARHGRRTGRSLPQPSSSPVHPHPWVLGPRQPTSPTGAAANACRCVSEPITSHDTAQAEASTVVWLLRWLIWLSWAQEPPALHEGNLLPPETCWLPHLCQLQPSATLN